MSDTKLPPPPFSGQAIRVLGAMCSPDGTHEWADESEHRSVYVTAPRRRGAMWRVVDTHGEEGGAYVATIEGTGTTLDAAIEDLIAQRIDLVRRLTGGAT